MIKFDHNREDRIRLPESVFCQDKTSEMIDEIIVHLLATSDRGVLFTRLTSEKFAQLNPESVSHLDYDALSGTALLGKSRPVKQDSKVAIVTAGTSDLSVAREALRTLQFLGIETTLVPDVGVAGLWRLEERLDEINEHDVIIVIAGMDAAIVSVLGGLTYRPIIAVPTSTGYGVSAKGQTALNSILVSCSPGITTVNIDNGYGAACAAARILLS
ncbi:nickel pincer cofactor biosynthesis protein LarB [Candidatus Neomarinimicrobiota bacterium]